MKKYLYLFLSLISINASATWDSSVLIGGWENYEFGYEHNYRRLTINEDFSGTLFSIKDDDEKYTYNFTKKDFEILDGLVVLNLNEGYKLVFSAWGESFGPDVKRILGQFFYYRIVNEKIELVNSVPVTFNPIDSKSLSEFLKKIDSK
ncbi:MAG: hypothetical protein OQL19_02570 [Gammaproteobacteria bacterium]|nr:hypothetical protein [Gammaproteobacteria bacterium]